MALLTQLVARVFTDMGAERDGGFLALRYKDKAYTRGRVLWAILKTHDQKHAKANIEDHPLILLEYVKFLASNAGRSDVSKLATSVADLWAMVNEQASAITKAGQK